MSGFRCQVLGFRIKRETGYITEKVYLEIRGGYKECIRMLNGLEKKLDRKIPERERRWQLAEKTAVYGITDESFPQG
ncbi:MAG: hypothetical protein DRH24_01770 [Deltaproteobacteria bacterium]|nr:MAG: hypothetical protein DRH24_01770 [Deltaproteobacteria bacterium]